MHQFSSRPVYITGIFNRLSTWAATWQMDFNVDKCNIMQFSNARHKSSFSYTMQGLPLCIVDRHSYLDVVLDYKLSWESHQHYISNKVNCLLAFLNRNLPRANHCLREYSYKQLVLPVLDYCATIWDPCYQNSIEMLQNRAAHFVLNRPWRGTIMTVFLPWYQPWIGSHCKQGGEILNWYCFIKYSMIIRPFLTNIYPPLHPWILHQITIRNCSTTNQELMYINFPSSPAQSLNGMI